MSQRRATIFTLPRETRDQIFADALFSFDNEILATGTIVVGIASHYVFTAPIIQTCHQFHVECEALIFQKEFEYRPDGGELASFVYPLSQLHPRRMNLIRRLCITSVTGPTLKLCEWTSALRSVPKRFSSVNSLIIELEASFISLFHTTDLDNGIHHLSRQPWVITLLATPPEINLKLLFWHEHEDRTTSCTGKDLETCFHDPLAKWLHDQVESRSQHTNTPPNVSSTPEPFNFLGLPSTFQRKIIESVILSPTKIIHPCLGPHFEQTSQSIIPLLLTCRHIHQLAEEVLYSEAIFTTCADSRYTEFKNFFYQRSDRQKQLMRSFTCNDQYRWMDGKFRKFLDEYPNLHELKHSDFMEFPCDAPGW
jgi:hypothetical protein